MGWDEDETVETENNTSWKVNEDVSNSKKKRNRNNRNRGRAASAAAPPAEDAESKGAGSSSGWEVTGTSNGRQRRILPKQAEPFQSNLGYNGSQEQRVWAGSGYQGQPNAISGSPSEVASSRRSRSQNGLSISNSTATWVKSGFSSTTVLKEDGARRTKHDFNGSVQKPSRGNERSRNNMGGDHAYKPHGYREGFNPENRAQKNLRFDNWGPRNQSWQAANKREKNQAWVISQPYRTGTHPEFACRESDSVTPPLAHGWQSGSRVNNSAITNETTQASNASNDAWSNLLPSEQAEEANLWNDVETYQSESASEPESIVEGSDDDWLGSGDDDASDSSQVSHEAQKKNKWFRKFFRSLDTLSIEEVNDSSRQWHCPACQGGVGAIDWYKGMQPLLSHAKTKRSKRVKLHRKLAEVLEEELERRGAAGLAAKEMLGQWKGLQEVTNDHMIVWPPMVVIQNTLLDRDEKDMWLGMGNKELLEYFKGYKAMKARHAYGPQGHRGMSVLIFEDSAMGYLEAERLHDHFAGEGRGKDDWDRNRRYVLFQPGGKRILYGYMATKEDMEIFNKHSKGKGRLKYDMNSYQLMVVDSMKQMSEDNQKLIWFKYKVIKEQEHSKILEETVSLVGRKLRTKENEIKIIRRRATEQHEESTREMNNLEQTYRQQIEQLYEDILRREHALEKMQEEFKKKHIDRCHKLEVGCAILPKDMEIKKDEHEKQAKIHEEIARQQSIVEMSIKESEEYEQERQELIREHDKRRREFRIQQLLEEVNYEKEFEQERLQILEKYSKKQQEAAAHGIN